PRLERRRAAFRHQCARWRRRLLEALPGRADRERIRRCESPHALRLSAILPHGTDGVIIGWLGLVGFKLAEVTDHHLVIGLGSGGGFLLMNKTAYDKLPGHAKAALDKHSGYEASRDAFGAALDRIYANSQAIVRGQPNQTISTLSPEELAH